MLVMSRNAHAFIKKKNSTADRKGRSILPRKPKERLTLKFHRKYISLYPKLN